MCVYVRVLVMCVSKSWLCTDVLYACMLCDLCVSVFMCMYVICMLLSVGYVAMYVMYVCIGLLWYVFKFCMYARYVCM